MQPASGRNWNWELENHHFLSLALFLPPLLYTCFIASSLVHSVVCIHDGIWLPYSFSQAQRCLSLNPNSTFLIEKIWLALLQTSIHPGPNQLLAKGGRITSSKPGCHGVWRHHPLLVGMSDSGLFLTHIVWLQLILGTLIVTWESLKVPL